MPSQKLSKENVAKVNKAIDAVEEAFEKLFRVVDKKLTKEDAATFKTFVMDNCYVAGGCFRSIFTDKPVKDYDVFFGSIEKATEFAAMVLSPTYASIFTDFDITTNNTFNFKHGTKSPQPYLSFVTDRGDIPEMMVDAFDFTFNRHYFRMKDHTFSFDIDTFHKIGSVHRTDKPLNTLMRCLRFTRDGFRIRNDSIISLVTDVANIGVARNAPRVQNDEVLRHLCEGASEYAVHNVMADSPSIHLTNIFYTDYDMGGANTDNNLMAGAVEDGVALGDVHTRYVDRVLDRLIEPVTLGAVGVRRGSGNARAGEYYNSQGSRSAVPPTAADQVTISSTRSISVNELVPGWYSPGTISQ